MAKVQKDFYTCDWPGCHEEWPVVAMNNNSMLLTFAVHPYILKVRKGRVVLEKNQYNFCSCHAKEVEEILIVEIMKARWRIGPELDKKMGCWIWAYVFDGNPDQLLFDHQVEYIDLEKLYYFFKSNVLSPKNYHKAESVYV